jgi:hypothetical protein
MRKSLILVGNKPPKKKLLPKKIDAFDFVVRINRMNYLGLAGNKIDGAFYEANWQMSHIYKGGEHTSEIKRINKIFMRRHWYNCFTDWHQYLSQEQYNNIEIINESYANEATKFENTTNAIKVLAHLLNTHWKEEYEIYITCLDVEHRSYLIDNDPIWDFHKGAGVPEQEFLEEQLKRKNIFRLHDN